MGKEFKREGVVSGDFTITAKAQDQLKKILSKTRDSTKNIIRFRILVAGGGCAGFQYVFKMDDAYNKEDQIYGEESGEVIIDDISLGLLKGASLDYEEELIGSQFLIKNNPQATTSCGCKTSFSVI